MGEPPFDPGAPPPAGLPASGGTDRWDDIVIERPTLMFEPLPPVLTSYRPDTVFDGWSSEAVTVRMASVRGYANRYEGLPRQDAAAVAYHRPSGAVAFAVADGVSATARPDQAAAIACAAALRILFAELDAGEAAFEWPKVLAAVSASLVEEARRAEQNDDMTIELARRCLAATLVAGIVRPASPGLSMSIAQVGDSTAWIVTNGTAHRLFDDRPDGSVIAELTGVLPDEPAQVNIVTGDLSPGEVLLVGTDGFADPFGDGDGKVGDILLPLLKVPPPARALAHVLDFSRETFDDDRSLLAVWPRPRAAGG